MPRDYRCPSCGKKIKLKDNFCSECGAALPAHLGSLKTLRAHAPGTLHSSPEAEWRGLTVMFCDLVGSTPLVNRDSEAAREIVGQSLELIDDVAISFGGHVVEHAGDGALIYFGFRQKREDDAERAVRAAVRILESASQLPVQDGYRPQFRIGIATGNVFVGKSIKKRGPDTGEPKNLAARLQEEAEPGSILICSKTRKATGGAFHCRDREPIGLKGFDHPIPVSEVVGEAAPESRFEALRGTVTPPLIGRDAQREKLLQRWVSAKSGLGQIVLISGEAGVGKSRLYAALLEDLAAERPRRLRYFCSPSQEGTPFGPIIAQLERAASITRDDDQAGKLEKLNRLLSANGMPQEDRLLIADLLSLDAKRGVPQTAAPSPDAKRGIPQTAVQSSHQRREETMRTLSRHLQTLAAQSPVLMIFEDIHWSDPSSLQLLDTVIDYIPKIPVLLILTFRRPDFTPPWPESPHLSEIELRRLDRSDCIELIEAVAGEVRLTEEVTERIIERADGIPLYLEELTQAVVESDPDQSDGGGTIAKAVTPYPDFGDREYYLYNSLMARLERIRGAKEVMQVGATIGREFSYGLLCSVLPSGVELENTLGQLHEAGLLQSRGTFPETTYTFRHALLQAAAYRSMGRKTRWENHRKIAEALETKDIRPEVLAHHYTEARMIQKAVPYWTQAGWQALGRSANKEAIGWLHRGLDLVGGLPEDESRHEHELNLLVVLMRAFITTTGYTSDDTTQTVKRARRVCDLLGQPKQLASVLNGQWVCAFIGGDLDDSRKRAKELLDLGTKRKNRIMTVLGYRALGLTCFALGEFVDARDHLERASAHYDPADQPYYAMQAQEDVHVLIQTYLSYVLTYLGYFEQALDIRERAFDEAHTFSQAYSRAHAFNARALTELLMGAPQDSLKDVDRLDTLNKEHALFYYQSFVPTYRGWAASELGDPKKGVELLKIGLEKHREKGQQLYEPEIRRWLASAYLRAQRYEDALLELDEATRIGEKIKALGDEGERHRVRADILTALGDYDGAVSSYHVALEAAERHKAKLWTLRAATGLARLLDRRGDRAQARAVLQEAYGRFTEGFDVPVLKGARELLDQLT